MGCPDGMRQSKKGGCVDANEDKINKLFESRRKKSIGPTGNRTIQNDWGSCRYNGFWHSSMEDEGVTERMLHDRCDAVNKMNIPDHYNVCPLVVWPIPPSNRPAEFCFWDWWDRMDDPNEEA